MFWGGSRLQSAEIVLHCPSLAYRRCHRQNYNLLYLTCLISANVYVAICQCHYQSFGAFVGCHYLPMSMTVNTLSLTQRLRSSHCVLTDIHTDRISNGIHILCDYGARKSKVSHHPARAGRVATAARGTNQIVGYWKNVFGVRKCMEGIEPGIDFRDSY